MRGRYFVEWPIVKNCINTLSISLSKFIENHFVQKKIKNKTNKTFKKVVLPRAIFSSKLPIAYFQTNPNNFNEVIIQYCNCDEVKLPIFDQLYGFGRIDFRQSNNQLP